MSQHPRLACCSFTILLPSFQTSKYPKTSQMECVRLHFDTLNRSPWRPWCTMAKHGPAALSVPRILLLWLLTGFHLADGDDPQDSPNRGALKRIAPLSIRSGIWNIMAGYWWYWSSEWDCNHGNKWHVMSLQDKNVDRHRQGRIFSVKTSG